MNKLGVIVIGLVLISGCAQINSTMPTNTNTHPSITNTLTPITSPTISYPSTITLTMPIYVPTPMIQDPYGNYMDWGEIPMMPGATSGDLEERKYIFDIKAKPEEVKAYYEKELKDHGWTLVRISPNPNGTSEPDNPFAFRFFGWNHQLLVFSTKYLNESSSVEIDFNTYGSYY